MISRKRIIRFAIGTMMRQDGWAEKYNPKNQFDVNQYDYSTCKEYGLTDTLVTCLYIRH